MARVLLVNPALAYSGWNADLSKPCPDSVFIRLGLAYLAGALRERGHDIRLADLRTLSGWGEYGEMVREFRPDFVGVTSHSVEHSYALEAARIAKKIAPSTTTVAGGIHPTMFPEECLKTGDFDHVIRGEGEIGFPDLIQNASQFPASFWGETPELDKVPFPDREIWQDYRKRMHCEPFGLSKYRFPLPTAELINTRGCPFRCTFCCGPGEHQLYTKVNGNGKRIPYIRGRSAANVLAELEMLVGKYAIRSAMFHDDQFLVSTKWVEEFISGLHRSGLVRRGFQWITSSRADLICRNAELLGEMAAAGLSLLIIGFESFSPRILRWFEKGTRVDENFKAAEICRKHGIRIWANFILGVPTDTGWHQEDDLLTVAGALKVDPVHFSPALYTPVPGSKLFDFYSENKLIDASLSSIEDISNRGKMATKVKGVDYTLLENLVITDSLLDAGIDLRGIMSKYSPAMGTMGEEEYIRAKSADAAAGIIAVMEAKSRKLAEACAALQAQLKAREEASIPAQPAAEASERLIRAVTTVAPLAHSAGNDPVRARISVVIPVLNGGERFGMLLDGLRKQKKIPDLEVLVFDSGSRDGSPDKARAAGARVVEVPKGTFSHGGTRQQGGRMATGEYVLFVVQDAVPSSDYMVYKMVRSLQDNPEVMVVSARQMTNRETDLYSRWSIDSTYASFNLRGDVKYGMRHPDLFAQLPPATKRIISFVDNVCACYRAEALRSFGFSAIENAEDIDAGARLVEAGRLLGYLHTAGAYHWHPLPPDYFLKRSFVGVKSMVEILDYRLPDFAYLRLDSSEEVRTRCRALYQAVRVSLDGMGGDDPLTAEDITRFLARLNGVMKDPANAGSAHGGNPELEAVLNGLGCGSGMPGDAAAFKNNHLLVSFSEHLRNLVNYVRASRPAASVGRREFADAIYKIVATRVGELAGHWYMKLMSEGKESEMESIRQMLFKGLCTS